MMSIYVLKQFRTGLLMFSVLLFCLILSCKETKKEVHQDIMEQEDSAEDVEMVEEKKEVITVPDVPLGFLVLYEGKYAAQEHLFEDEILAKRLQVLERFNYEVLLQNYNPETPIVNVGGIIHMSGCKQHACPSSAYEFFIDLSNDNINIYHFRNNMLRMYQEKGMIELPPQLANELEIKKNNAGIGNTESIESKYEL